MKNKKSSKHEEVKIYEPQPEVISAFKTFPLVDCVTESDGRYVNPSEDNIEMCKKEVDDNHK